MRRTAIDGPPPRGENGRHASYRNHYTHFAGDLVARRYADDIRVLGSEF
jgi:hypothetical protein